MRPSTQRQRGYQLGFESTHSSLVASFLSCQSIRNPTAILMSEWCRIGAAAKSVIRLLPAAAAQLLKRVHQVYQAKQSLQSSCTSLTNEDIISLGETAMQFTSVAFKVCYKEIQPLSPALK